MSQIPICCAVVRDSDKYLLVRSGENDRYGKWGLPGGKINFGESPDKAIGREVYEETGFLINNLSLFGIYCSVPNSDNTLWVINFAYRANFVGSAKEPDGEEILDIGWFTFYEIKRIVKDDLMAVRDNFKIILDSSHMLGISGLEKIVNVLEQEELVNV